MPSPDVHDASASPDFLTVYVDGGTGDTNYTLLISRPVDGRVHVREWLEENRGGAAYERYLSEEEVYVRLERAYTARHRLSVGLMRIRAWLDGRA
jgi:hypothetical protein